jgi:hypothetical protein
MFVGGNRILLDLVAEGDDRREGGDELEDADCADEARDVGELRDGGADYEGESPVDGHETDPEEFAGFGGEGGSVKEFRKDLAVGDFDADVTVQRGSNQPSDEIHDITSRLPVVRGEALHSGVISVLPLVGVDEKAKEQVDRRGRR